MKNNLISSLVSTLFLLSLISCSHQKNGQAKAKAKVVNVIDEQSAYISRIRGPIAVGDKITIYRIICNAGKDIGNCDEKKLGNGNVIKILDEDYAEVKFQEGAEFRRNTKVRILR